jgi:glycerophosphoryl diester phosphodiesterase
VGQVASLWGQALGDDGLVRASLTRQEPAARPRSRRRSLAQLLLLMLAAVVLWYGAAWLRRSPAVESLAVIAHRGAPDGSGEPEGTIGAFQAALEAGADWLEFDVRRTSDGVLVVLHDVTVDRTTSGTGPITGLTLADVQALDAGGGARIPTVDEVVAVAKRAGIPILPEIKQGAGTPGLTGQLVDLLRASGYLAHSVIQSSEAETLEELRRLAPEAKACWITGLGQIDLSSPPADAEYICAMGEMVMLNPDMVRQAHEAGREVFAWWAGLETPITDRILESYGVDGLIVDDLRPFVTR